MTPSREAGYLLRYGHFLSHRSSCGIDEARLLLQACHSVQDDGLHRLL